MKLIKTLAAPLSLALITAPLAAQEEETAAEESAEAVADPAALFGEMFEIEPLTPEQEARLPVAKRVAAQVLPEGAMAASMNDMMFGVMNPFSALGGSGDADGLYPSLGASVWELDLTDEQSAELKTLFDPSWEERRSREKTMTENSMSALGAAMEPAMRDAMAEVYAIHFTEIELGALEAFFNTPVGAKFARESYTMATDPRLMRASLDSMSDLINTFSAIGAVGADLPPARTFADLSETEKARVSEITGLTAEEIEAGLEAGVAVEATETYDEEEEWVEEEAVEAAE